MILSLVVTVGLLVQSAAHPYPAHAARARAPRAPECRSDWPRHRALPVWALRQHGSGCRRTVRGTLAAGGSRQSRDARRGPVTLGLRLRGSTRGTGRNVELPGCLVAAADRG